MHHDYIDQSDLIDSYIRGRLTADESERFEEHFIDCLQCIDRLKTARDFKQGLRLLTVEQVSKQEIDSAKGLRGPFLERSTWKKLAVATCCLLFVVIIGSILQAIRVRHLGQEAGRAMNTSSEWQRRYEEQQQATLSAEQQRQEIEQNLRGQISQLETELQNEQKQQPDKSGELPGSTQPDINLPILVLSSVRGDGQNITTGVNEIRLPRSQTNFMMFVPLEGESKYKTYRVSILADERPFWGRAGLKPDRYNYLTMSFNLNFFRAGDYLLRVEGVPRAGDSGIIGNYPFRIIKHP